jgi:hypothetical protein
MPLVTAWLPTLTDVVPKRPLPVIVTSGGFTVSICVGVTPVICGGVGSCARHAAFCRHATICACSPALKAPTLPEQPPMTEHMIPQAGAASQCVALKLCPSSCALSPTRCAKLIVQRVCDRP